MFRYLIIGFLSLFLCACIHVYRPDIQQGNILKEETVKQVHVGMTTFEVQRLLGEPVLKNTFNQNRALYVYEFIPNTSEVVKKKFVLTFKNNQVVNIN